MKIFKFGGASINSKKRIANTGSIISSFEGEKLLIVVSAMGKTTNALEEVAHSFFQSKKLRNVGDDLVYFPKHVLGIPVLNDRPVFK